MLDPDTFNQKVEGASIRETTNNLQQKLNIVDKAHEVVSTVSQHKDTAATGAEVQGKFEGKTESESEGVDSGFLSGPQINEDYQHLVASGYICDKSPVHSVLNTNPKDQTTSSDYQDSGCIDDESTEQEKNQIFENLKKKPSITTTAATPQAQFRTFISSSVDDGSPMILESGADAGVAEWFCKLSLRDSNQQVNNLGAVNRRDIPNIQKAEKVATNTDDASDKSPWEIYYQQNDEGDTQLHLACITGYVDVVAALIRMAPYPCLFNIQNDEAQTGLHLAVVFGQPKILRMLLIAGAEPTVRDRNGNTPLHLACMSGDIQCVKALTLPISASEINEAHRAYGHLSSDKTTSYLEYTHLPPDLEMRNYDGERCVHLAAQGGHIEILRHLVWFGADINAREGKSGRTPLHIAIECCNEILANFLLEECSKLNLETATYAGMTAYQVASVLKNSAMQNNLEKRGAEPLTPPDSEYESDVEVDLDDIQGYDQYGRSCYFTDCSGGNAINVA